MRKAVRVAVGAKSATQRARVAAQLSTSSGIVVVGAWSGEGGDRRVVRDLLPEVLVYSLAAGETVEAVEAAVGADFAPAVVYLVEQSGPVPAVSKGQGLGSLSRASPSRSFVPKGCATALLCAAVAAAAVGLVVLHPALTEQTAGGVPAAARSRAGLYADTRKLPPGGRNRPAAGWGSGNDDPITPREREVLSMIAEGLPNKAIASELGITPHTVKFHIASIMQKLDASSRTEAVTIGLRRGIILL